MSLDEFRKTINNLDKDLIETLASRFTVTDLVGQFKKEKKLEIYAPEREKELIRKNKNLAKESGISEELIEKIYLLILKESRRRQEIIIKNDN